MNHFRTFVSMISRVKQFSIMQISLLGRYCLHYVTLFWDWTRAKSVSVEGQAKRNEQRLITELLNKNLPNTTHAKIEPIPYIFELTIISCFLMFALGLLTSQFWVSLYLKLCHL